MSTSALFTLSARSLNVVVMACKTPGRLDALTLMMVLLVSPALSKLTVSAGSRPPDALPPPVAAARGAARSRRARAARFAAGAGQRRCRTRQEDTPKDSMAGGLRSRSTVPDGTTERRLVAGLARRLKSKPSAKQPCELSCSTRDRRRYMLVAVGPSQPSNALRTRRRPCSSLNALHVQPLLASRHG